MGEVRTEVVQPCFDSMKLDVVCTEISTFDVVKNLGILKSSLVSKVIIVSIKLSLRALCSQKMTTLIDTTEV